MDSAQCSPPDHTHSEPLVIATSQDANYSKKRGFTMRLMMWRALSVRPYCPEEETRLRMAEETRFMVAAAEVGAYTRPLFGLS